MDGQRPAQSFRELVVWQKAHELVCAVYRLSDDFPSREMFGLTQQLRRAAFSVPANIAEGFKRRGLRDKAHFMNIAEGSLEECRYFLILAHDLGFADTGCVQTRLDAVARLLNAYADRLRDDAGRRVGSPTAAG